MMSCEQQPRAFRDAARMESSTAPVDFSPSSFHRIGFVVASIQNCVEGFLQWLQAEWDGNIFHDPNHGVRVTFEPPAGGRFSLGTGRTSGGASGRA
jgi:hypothetical protein